MEEYAKEWDGFSAELKKEIGWSPADELADYEKRKRSCDGLVRLVRQLLENTDELELYAVLHDPDYN